MNTKWSDKIFLLNKATYMYELVSFKQMEEVGWTAFAETHEVGEG